MIIAKFTMTTKETKFFSDIAEDLAFESREEFTSWLIERYEALKKRETQALLVIDKLEMEVKASIEVLEHLGVDCAILKATLSGLRR